MNATQIVSRIASLEGVCAEQERRLVNLRKGCPVRNARSIQKEEARLIEAMMEIDALADDYYAEDRERIAEDYIEYAPVY